MASTKQLHAWVDLLTGSDVVNNKVALAIRLYMAQPDMPDISSILELRASDVEMKGDLGDRLSATEISNPGQSGLHLKLDGSLHFAPRLGDITLCPVAGFMMELFSLEPGMMGPGSSQDDIMSVMNKPLFSKAGDGTLPVMSISDFCARAGKAMATVLGIPKPKTDQEVLQMLALTRAMLHPGHQPAEVPHPQVTQTATTATSPAPGTSVAQNQRKEKLSGEAGGPNKICSVCGAQSKFKCAGCSRMRYCSRACQKSHWKQHKEDCNSSGRDRVYAGGLIK